MREKETVLNLIKHFSVDPLIYPCSIVPYTYRMFSRFFLIYTFLSIDSKHIFNMDRVAAIEIDLLKLENNRLQEKLNSKLLEFKFHYIETCDKSVMQHTRLPNAKVFRAVLNLSKKIEFNYHAGWRVEKISKESQLLVTLMKLRMNLKNFDLAMRFGCSVATISNITHTWILALNEILYMQLMKNIPSVQKNLECLPESFKDFENTRIIIDCTEIHCDSPQNINNKNCNSALTSTTQQLKDWLVLHLMVSLLL